MAKLGIALVALLLVGSLVAGPLGLGHLASAATRPAPISSDVRGPVESDRPLASTVVGGVAAVSTDTSVANNEGLNTTFNISSSVDVPSGDQAFVGVSESISANVTTSVGVGLDEVLGTTYGAASAILPNGTAVYSTTAAPLNLGSYYTFSFLHAHGWWWTYTYSGTPITGSSSWMNGTYNLGLTAAEGIANGSTLPDPAFMAVETGSGSFPLAEIEAPHWAIGVARAGTSSATYQPRSAEAVELAASPSTVLGIEGQAQVPALPLDSALMAGGIGYPGNLAEVWGPSAPQPLTADLFGYSNEPALASSLGASLTLTVPSVTLSSSERAGLGVLLPYNGTTTLGVGLQFMGSGSTTVINPYYEVGTSAGQVQFYVDGSLALTTGEMASLTVQGHGSSWWTFDEGSTPIAAAASGAGNGSVDLGRSSAVTLITASPTMANATSSYAETPAFVAWGDIPQADLSIDSALTLDRGGTWETPDYAFADDVVAGVGVEGQVQTTIDPMGTLDVGTGVATLPLGTALWKGDLSASLVASDSTIVAGGSVGLNVTVESHGGVAFPPAILTVTANTPTSTLSGLDVVGEGTFPGTISIPTDYAPSTVNVSFEVTALGYNGANSSLTLTVGTVTLVLASHLSPSVVVAGGTTELKAWLNTSLGTPVAGASLTLNGVPAAWIGSTTGSSGAYTIPITTGTSITQTTTYTLGVNVTSSQGDLVETSVATLTVDPAGTELPLTVIITPEGASVVSGAPLTINISVASGGLAIPDATIDLTYSPAWAGAPSSETTGSTGESTIDLTAPSVSVVTTYLVQLEVTASGHSARSAETNITVDPPSTSPPPSTNSTPFVSLSNPLFLGLIVVVVVIVIAAVALALRRRPPSTPTNPAAGAPAYAEYPGAPAGYGGEGYPPG